MINKRGTRSAKGQVVDFDVLKAQASTVVKQVVVDDSTRFIDSNQNRRLSARAKMIPEELLKLTKADAAPEEPVKESGAEEAPVKESGAEETPVRLKKPTKSEDK